MTISNTHTYQRGPTEILEAGTIRCRSMIRRHGITSPQTLEVVQRFGQMIDDARTTTEETPEPQH